MSGINYVDIALIILIVLLGIKGIVNGLVKEFFGLVGIVGGVWGASLYAKTAGAWISQNIYNFNNEALVFIVGFVCVLGFIWILMIIVSEITSKMVGASALGPINRFLGVLFAMTKVFFVISIILYALFNVEFMRKTIDNYTEGSTLYPIMLRAGAYIVRIDSVQKITRDTRLNMNEIEFSPEK